MIPYPAGRPVLALGATGGRRIPNTLLDVLVQHLVRGRPLAAAVQAPRLNTEFAEVLISYHHWFTTASTVMILLCFAGVWIRSEPFMICCVFGAYFALAALACTHLAMLRIMRRAAHTRPG